MKHACIAQAPGPVQVVLSRRVPAPALQHAAAGAATGCHMCFLSVRVAYKSCAGPLQVQRNRRKRSAEAQAAPGASTASKGSLQLSSSSAGAPGQKSFHVTDTFDLDTPPSPPSQPCVAPFQGEQAVPRPAVHEQQTAVVLT